MQRGIVPERAVVGVLPANSVGAAPDRSGDKDPGEPKEAMHIVSHSSGRRLTGKMSVQVVAVTRFSTDSSSPHCPGPQLLFLGGLTECTLRILKCL